MCIRDSGKAVRPHPRQQIGIARPARQPRRHLAQERVAGGLAEAVVDVLEAVSYTHLDVYKRQVEDGCLLAPQVILNGPQQEWPSVSIRHRIDLACGQFLQALRTRVQGVDQRRDFVAYLAGKR